MTSVSGKSDHSVISLMDEIRACRLCEAHLPLGPRPLLQMSSDARILIAGQAPGVKAHESSIPFDDASGQRLRAWLGMDRDTFYNAEEIAILPMAFCYPGRGKSGDLPPRSECAETWRQRVLEATRRIQLTIVIGQYARAWHCKDSPLLPSTLTDHVRQQDVDFADTLVMPHPSPRNNIWLKRNAWFEDSMIPAIQKRVSQALSR